MIKLLKNTLLLCILYVLLAILTSHCEETPRLLACFPASGTKLPLDENHSVLKKQLEDSLLKDSYIGFDELFKILPEETREANKTPDAKEIIPFVLKLEKECILLTCYTVDDVQLSKEKEQKSDFPLSTATYCLSLKYSVLYYDTKSSKLLDSEKGKVKESGNILLKENGSKEIDRLKARLLITAARRAGERIARKSQELVEPKTELLVSAVEEGTITCKLTAGKAPNPGVTFSIYEKIKPDATGDGSRETRYNPKGEAVVLSVSEKTVKLKLISGKAEPGYLLRLAETP